MSLVLERVEDWKQIITGLNAVDANASPQKLMHPDAGYDAPCLVLEWKVRIVGATTSDVDLYVYGCPDGDAALLASEPRHVINLNCRGVTPYRNDGVFNWDEIGSGFRMSMFNDGVDAGTIVDLWVRRNRWNERSP